MTEPRGQRPSPAKLDVESVLQDLAVTASHSLHFREVAVNVRQPDGMYKVVADTGGQLTGTLNGPQRWDELLREEYKVSGSYLIPPHHAKRVLESYRQEAYVVPDISPATDPDDWDPYNMLIVPLFNSRQEVIGYFSIDSPEDGKLPSPERISDMETFARHAALTIEQAELFEHLEAEAEALRRSEEHFRSLIEDAPDVIIIMDANGVIRYGSPAVERVLGYNPEELVGRVAFDLVHPEEVEKVRSLHAEIVHTHRPAWLVEIRCLHKDGSWRYLEITSKNMLEKPEVRGLVINARDVTERKLFEARLEHQALHDSLTGLPNRVLLINRLESSIARSHRNGLKVGLLYLNLDHFKYVNDSLGHDVGDEALVSIARRLLMCLRAGDTFARLGGDEFVVLLEDVAGLEEVVAVAKQITEVLQTSIDVRGHEVFVTTSIGVVLSASGADKPTDLLRDADNAMYRAKSAGGGSYELFNPSTHARALDRLDLEARLRKAIEREELEVYYQPMVSLSSGRIVGFEALVRWHHPERGLLNPGAFIQLAEETGLILSIDRWVLVEACRQARVWHHRYPQDPELVVSVNLSARQFDHPEIIDDIAYALNAARLEPSSLWVEITESWMMIDVESTIAMLSKLKALGVRVAIDDFGSRYSSFNYLRQFSVDMLKVDRPFVEGLGQDQRDEAIMRAMVMLSGSLDAVILAEGVETADQLKSLRDMGCGLVQGYYFSKPISAMAADQLLAEEAAQADTIC